MTNFENQQIKGITYKMLFGFISVIVTIISSALFITVSITDYKNSIRSELKMIYDRSVYNREKIESNKERIIVLEGITGKHETEIKILQSR